MAKLIYVARDSSGKKVSGSEEVSSPEDLVSRLQARNLIVIDILPEVKDSKISSKTEIHISSNRRLHAGVNEADLVLYCRQLATLLGAGVTILKSLEIILKQVNSRRLYTIIKNMVKDMESGLSLHESMAKHSKIFSDLWVNLVESGEASGNLAVVLNRLAGYLERNAEFKKKIISALIYPMILMFAGLGALFFLTTQIIPTFAVMFEGFKVELPLLTRILIMTSTFLRNSSLPILGIIIV